MRDFQEWRGETGRFQLAPETISLLHPNPKIQKLISAKFRAKLSVTVIQIIMFEGTENLHFLSLFFVVVLAENK